MSAVAAFDPGLAARALVVIVLGIAAVFAPTWVAAPVLVAGTAIVPSVLLANAQGGGSAAFAAFGGQARWLTVALLFVAARALLARELPNVRYRGAAALVASTAGFLLAAVLGLLQSRAYSGDLGSLSRDLTYPLAVFVAVAAVQDARKRGAERTLYRALAAVTILIGLSCVAYWASTTGVLKFGSPLEDWFDRARNTTGPHVFQSGRSIFPLVQDSPNLGALAQTMLAALTVPLLIELGNRRDTMLAAAVAVVSGGAVLATQSRTGLLAFAAAATIYTWAKLRRRGVPQVHTALALVAVVAVVLGTYAAILGTSNTEPGNVDDRSLSARTETLGAREAIWKQAVTAAYEKPIGYGYQYSIHGDFVEPTASGGAVAARQQSVHQQFLAEMVDGGVVGLALFGVVLLMMIKLTRDRAGAAFGHRIALAAVLAAAATAMIGNTVTQSAACQTLLWFAFGIALGAPRPSYEGGLRQTKPQV